MQNAEQPSSVLKRMIDGYQISQGIHVVARLGIADLLQEGPRTCDDLARDVDADAPALYRVMRALAAAGVFAESSDRTFALTPLSECLRADAPDSLAAWASFVGQSYQWTAWGYLFESVRTGANAFRLVHGMGAWEYRAQHPDQSRIFDRAMVAISRRQTAAIVTSFDFSRFRSVVDVGGGRGALMAAILKRYPDMRGILFDQPHVVTAAQPLLEAAGVAGRCRLVEGDFFEAVPQGEELYLLKAILHDWDDEQSIAILKACRTAIPADGTLLVIEMEIESQTEGLEAALTDLRMLIGPGGQERTRDEYARLLAAAGFRLVASHPTSGELQVIEARPA